jgi:uncharacterized protein
MRLLERLTSPGPKRILALDGGGVRGMVALGFLNRIEAIFRARYRQSEFKLADYFDLIGGTSTGAIIAAGLALGLDVSTITRLYLELGRSVFSRRRLRMDRARFDVLPLEHGLRQAFGDHTLGDEAVRTGLCVMTKRADTRSTWPLLNHPLGMYYELNRSILIRDAVRASAAAPSYFVPEKLAVQPGQYGAFVDGSVSTANNPALQLLLIATLKGFHFNWPTGEDRLLLVSVGTGNWRRLDDVDRVTNWRLWDWAIEIPTMLMEDSNWFNQLLLQCLSRSQTPWTIDAEVGDLTADLLSTEPAFSYLRYDVWLDAHGLEELGVAELVPSPQHLRDLSAAGNLDDLTRIGNRAAERQVRAEHFPPSFDVTAAL